MMTVLLATRNRAESLHRMLEGLLPLHAPSGGWKLVIADNGSSDGTAQVLERYLQRLPLSVVYEPRAGKNRALNRALTLAEGDLIVFTDDDVIADPDWLVRLRQAAIEKPEAEVFGGTIIPLWPGARPAFASESAVDFGLLFAQKRRSSGWCKPEEIYGPNMAVRARMLEDGFAFSEAVGPNESQRSYVMGGEFDLLQRLSKVGFRAWFVAEARVQHIIRPEQLTEDWILERYYRYGLFMNRNNWGRGPVGMLKRLVWSALAVVAGLTPPSPLRLRIQSRRRLFQGIFAAIPPVPRSHGQEDPL